MTSHKTAPASSLEEQNLIIHLKYKECNQTLILDEGEAWGCPGTWDGLLCWPRTPPGTAASAPCPPYMAGFNLSGVARKVCTERGEWFVSEETNATWTNYSQCFSGQTTTVLLPFHEGLDPSKIQHIAKFIPSLKILSQVGYGISLSSLVVAFGILATFRRLRCPRNLLHMHLFVSFMLKAFLTLLKNGLFYRGVGLPSDFASAEDGGDYFVGEYTHNWSCKILISVWQYFIMANYSWILMEGLYLHNLIFLALFSDTSAVHCYVCLGWSLPALFVLPWAVVRALLDDTLCWTTYRNPDLVLIVKLPTVVFMLINFVLFINIVRVLLLKLTASISEENRRYRYRRWAKSTLVLVPLFGGHFTILIWMHYVGANGSMEIVWLYADQLFMSFQGFFVAVLYCFMNGEVRSELGKKWRKARELGRGGGKQPQAAPRSGLSLSGGGGGFFRRKRGSSTVESCMTTFISSAQPDSTRRPPPPNQYIDVQSDVSASKMLSSV